jgi:septal ring factor EnvC (AmiA/AmiB activator)
VVVVAPNRSIEEAKSIAASHRLDSSVHFIHHEAREALAAAERDVEEAAGRASDLERDLARARREAGSAEAKRDRIAAKVEEAERKLEEVSEP